MPDIQTQKAEGNSSGQILFLAFIYNSIGLTV